MVQNLIERCMQLYMSRSEVVATLLSHAKVKPQLTDLVWQRLEEENADFFKAYHVKLKLKDQTCFFNYLLHRQSHMMMKQPEGPNFPLASMQNERQHLPVDSLPPPHSFINQPPNPTSSIGYHPSSSSMGTIPRVEDRNHTIGNFISLANSESGIVMNEDVADTVPIIPVDSLPYSVIKQPPIPSDYLPINNMTAILSDNEVVTRNFSKPFPSLNQLVPNYTFTPPSATSENLTSNFIETFPLSNRFTLSNQFPVNYPNALMSNQQGFEGFHSLSCSPEIRSDSPNQNG